MVTRSFHALPIAVLVTALVAAKALAATAESEQHFKLWAEEVSVDKAANQVTARGSVKVELVKSGVTLTADEIVISDREIVIPGQCVIELPDGKIFVENARFLKEGGGFIIDPSAIHGSE